MRKSIEAPTLPLQSTTSANIMPLSRVWIQAFCETLDTAGAIQAAAADRHLGKVHHKIQMGGIAAATKTFTSAPTPSVIIVESRDHDEELLAGLDSLCNVCDAGARIIVLSRRTDILLYRELMRRGVSDYLILPLSARDLVRSISGLFVSPNVTVGRIIAVVGAKGGVGSSTIAHNIAWAVARDLQLKTVVVDLDFAFGTASLNYNQDPPQGIADAVFSPARVNTDFVCQLLSKCADCLSLLGAPATLDRVYDFSAEAFDEICNVLRATIHCTILDIPHQWTGWTKRVLMNADDVLIVAGPDLANLRNTKNLLDLLRTERPNDPWPSYCLNQVRVPKRPEISPTDFAKALDQDILAVIPFEPQIFGTAANNGQMIAELASSHRMAETFGQLARALIGHSEMKTAKSGIFGPLFKKLIKRSA